MTATARPGAKPLPRTTTGEACTRRSRGRVDPTAVAVATRARSAITNRKRIGGRVALNGEGRREGGPRGSERVVRRYFLAGAVPPPEPVGATGAGAPLIVIGTVTAVGATFGPSRSSASYGVADWAAFANATWSVTGVFAGTAPDGTPVIVRS